MFFKQQVDVSRPKLQLTTKPILTLEEEIQAVTFTLAWITIPNFWDNMTAQLKKHY